MASCHSLAHTVHRHPAFAAPVALRSPALAPCLRPSLTPLAPAHRRPAAPRRLPARRALHCATAAPSPSDPSPGAGGGGVLSALYKFTRPHTIRGTILGSLAGCARAIIEQPTAIDWGLLPRAAVGMVALLLGNAFIVGINQIFDVRIDRINKPFLPLAAGTLSNRLAWIFTVASALGGLFIVRTCFSPLIFALYSFGMCIGGMYSVPPFRLKRFPLMAALTISCVRGFLLNFGVYHATKNALSLPFVWSPPISFLAVFMSIFAIVIALAKDLPDIKGDVAVGVPTFASRFGPRRMVNLVLGLLSGNYIFAIVSALVRSSGFNTPAMLTGHIGLLVYMLWYSRKIDPTSQTSIKRFYAFIWRLFYAEYMLFPFI